MSLGVSAATGSAMLDAAIRAVAFTGVANPWVELHVGDPGVNGTANLAGNATRHQATFGASARVGSTIVAANTGAVVWSTSEVDTNEDYTHFSLWSASSGGSFIVSGTITANPVTIGNTFTIAIGGLTVTLLAAS